MMRKLSPPELAEMIGKRVKLRQDGRNHWTGLCPFHNEKTPSFHIFMGTKLGHEDEGLWGCSGCHAFGDAAAWLMRVEGKSYRQVAGGTYRPDPVIARAREERRLREIAIGELRDRYPDLPEEFEMFVVPDLRARLLRHLRRER